MLEETKSWMSSAEMTKLEQRWDVVSLLVYKQTELLRINQWWDEAVLCPCV